MKKFKLLSHTADIRLLLEASTREELFEVAVLGMNEVMKKGGCVKCKNTINKTLSLTSVDITSLLVDFMSEVLTLSYEEVALYCEFEILKLDETSLTATIKGCSIDSFDTDVKAVTYHEADVKKSKLRNWETVIIFDV